MRVGGATSRATAASGERRGELRRQGLGVVARGGEGVDQVRGGFEPRNRVRIARTPTLRFSRRWLRAERSVASTSSTMASVEMAAAPHARRQRRNMDLRISWMRPGQCGGKMEAGKEHF